MGHLPMDKDDGYGEFGGRNVQRQFCFGTDAKAWPGMAEIIGAFSRTARTIGATKKMIRDVLRSLAARPRLVMHVTDLRWK